jgi:hypothetical protein
MPKALSFLQLDRNEITKLIDCLNEREVQKCIKLTNSFPRLYITLEHDLKERV